MSEVNDAANVADQAFGIEEPVVENHRRRNGDGFRNLISGRADAAETD